uniref:Maf1 regulator, putative n=1 Tax=Theileria annulata TaxID=5874 RepID=A0A3B0NJ79_THEAN
MIFLDHPGLSRINSIFQCLDAPDRYFDTNFELVSYSKSDENLKHDPSEFLTKSVSHDFTTYFKAILNKCFQDYNFSNLDESYFKKVNNFDTVVNTIYYNISFVVTHRFPNFADEFWQTIREVVYIKDVDIYTFDSCGEDDPFNSEVSLNSFNYFFLDKKQQRILFISCVRCTRSDAFDKSDYTSSFQPSIYSDNLNTKPEEDCLSDYDIPETNVFNL